jgi:predicted ATPase/DNA-binding CsgD family transcriptional regulator
LTELKRLLRERRLITLTGAGGSGKTRLALEAVATLNQDFPGGIFLVELAPLSRPELVAEAMVRVLSVEVAPERPPIDALTDFLHTRIALLVLDNCEHLLGECAHLADALLASCPDLSVLATSREPLGIGGECIFRVPLLSLPDPSETSDPAKLTDFEAVQLFMDRVRLVSQDFVLTQETGEAVAQVCIRLDGIPLALELAAASLRVLSISQLSTRLDQRFRLLTSGNRTALPRHQTLQALLDWSYTLLDERQQVIFCRLAIFPADWTLDAAEAVCGVRNDDKTIPQLDVLNIIFPLVDKSLVQLERTTGRYRMLETVRLYAFQRLESTGEQESVARYHFDWYLRFAEYGATQIGGPGQQLWFTSLETEQTNLRAALGYAIATGFAEGAARLALSLWKFWLAGAYHREGLRWLEQILTLDGRRQLDAGLRARLLSAMGAISHHLNLFEQAGVYHNEALRIWREQDDSVGVATAVLDLGWQYFQATDLEVSRRYAEESLTLARRTGDRPTIAAALHLFAISSVELGILDNQVLHAIDECLAIWRDLNILSEVVAASLALVRIEQELGNLRRAIALFKEALGMQASLGSYTGLIGCLACMFKFAQDVCRPPRKNIYLARTIGVFNAIEEKIGGGFSPWTNRELTPIYSQLIDELGKDNFDRELAAGKALTVEKVVELGEEIVREVTTILEEDAGTAPARTGAMPVVQYPSGLTPREVEVLKLVAGGLTNQQIAERLSVTPSTINAHLTSIYSKIGVSSRAGAVRFALDHDLA